MSSTPNAKLTPQTGARGTKAKPKKLVVLKLSSTHLGKWPCEPSPAKPSLSKAQSSTSSSSSTSDPIMNSPPAASIKAEIKPDLPATPSTLQVPPDGKKKAPGGPKTGTKRPLGTMNEGTPKARVKPGPKKRKLDGTLGPDEANRPWTTPAPAAGHKLGPKANQGAINAGLRALDRTGKPCRKWAKKPFSVKSFTGVVWTLPSWGTSKRAQIKDEIGQNGTPTSNSENQENQGSSNVGSDTSRPNTTEPPVSASSPALVAASA